MPKNLPFVLKLLQNLEKIDQATLKKYLYDLAVQGDLYETMLDELQEGVMLINVEGKIAYFNAPVSSLLGLPQNARSDMDLSALADEAFAASVLKAVKSQAWKKVFDSRLLLPRETEVRTSCAQAGESGLFVVVIERLEGRKAAAGKPGPAVEGILSLAAGIAHEIGNPLNAISIHLALLQKEIKSLPDNKKKTFEKTLDVLSAETGRLDRIVRNFLKAARKPPLRFKTEDLNRILEAAIDFMKPELAENKVTVAFKGDETIPPFLMDRERLHQTFINLIKNAMEAMPKGGRLGIRVSKKEKAALLMFKDNGTGISEEDLPHIFEAYYTTKTEGSGLGLMSVWRTVEEHGGRIEVASKEGQGTTFSLMLPIREPKLQLSHSKGK